MLYYSKNSNVAHFDGCHHMKKIREGNLLVIDTYAEAKEKNFRICKCCDPIAKSYKKEEAMLTTFCAQNGLICFPKKHMLNLHTVHSKWKIVPSDNGGLAVYHKNIRHKENDMQSPIAGYHLQWVNEDSIIGICKYIIGHDGYRWRNPVQGNKKTKEKKAPKKGTHRWRTEQEKIKKQNRRNAIKNVYSIFDQLEAARVYG